MLVSVTSSTPQHLYISVRMLACLAEVATQIWKQWLLYFPLSMLSADSRLSNAAFKSCLCHLRVQIEGRNYCFSMLNTEVCFLWNMNVMTWAA